jgi:predicted PurR-regulated permease PerM
MAEAEDKGREQILQMVRWLLYLVFVVIGYWILLKLGPVLTPLLAAAAIAYLLDPLVDKLVARGFNRSLAVALLLGSFISLIAAVLVILIPWAAADLSSFIAGLPAFLERATSWLNENVGVELPSSWHAWVESPEVKDSLKTFAGPVAELAAAALGGILSTLAFLAEFLLVPVFAFYFLVDWDGILERTRSIVPPRHRDTVVEIASEIDSVVSGWIRGQFTVTFILTLLYAISFEIIGFDLALAVGALVGALTIIPFVGTVVGAILTGLLLVLNGASGSVFALVAAVFVVLHLLEAGVLTPKIVGHRVGLSEVAALFAVLGGGKLLGFTGVLLAVPIAAAIAVLVRRVVAIYEDSDFYQDAGDDAVADPGS